jgi:NAD(P)-dependent dehydrogenase (short-subunit alcohol dehydrogenase family)
MPKSSVCCVIGAGDATGSALARRFAKEGYTVCAARRNEAAL